MRKREVRYLKRVDLVIDRKRDDGVLSAALGKRIERFLSGKRSVKKVQKAARRRLRAPNMRA